MNGLPVGASTVAPALSAAVGEQDVGGDHDVAGARRLGDPVVGGVEAVAHHHPLDQRMIGDADPAVADYLTPPPVPPRDPVNLVLHRAGVGIDQDSD